MVQYLDLLRLVLESGKTKDDRTGTGTISVFGAQARFPVGEFFPALTTKKLHLRSIIHELLWFLKGETNIKYLNDNGVTIWDEWADDNGDLGRVYGAQWCDWKKPDGTSVNQVNRLISELKNNPNSRRHIISAWNAGELNEMALTPCHAMVQFYIHDGELSCQLYQRSADLFLGVPFNIASYALLTHIVAQQCDLEVGDFVWSGGDCHVYSNHFEQVETQLKRTPKKLPKILIHRKPESIFDYKYEDFELSEYEHDDPIKAPVAI